MNQPETCADFLSEDDSRAKLRQLLGVADERAVSLQTEPGRRLHMLSRLNAANLCLRRHREMLGPNGDAVLSAARELAT